MPVVEIEIVGAGPLRAGLAAELAAGLAGAMGSRPGGTWVRLHRLDRGDYAEGDGGPPAGVDPIFVTVLRADVPPEAVLREEAREVARTVASMCDRPVENVHVFYQPPGRGRVAFGGELRE